MLFNRIKERITELEALYSGMFNNCSICGAVVRSVSMEFHKQWHKEQ